MYIIMKQLYKARITVDINDNHEKFSKTKTKTKTKKRTTVRQPQKKSTGQKALNSLVIKKL